jgi:hypothetical protein
MSKSIRFVRRGVHGRIPMNFNMPGVIKSRQAVVHITAAEIQTAPVFDIVGGHDEQKFIYNVGDADIWVTNVSPHSNDHFFGEPGGVGFVLHVNWHAPLDVAITITVEDAPPFEIQN